MSESRQTYLSRGEAPDRAPGLDDDLKESYAAALYYFAHIGGVNEHEERVVEEVAREQGIDAATLAAAGEIELDAQQLGALLKRVNGAYLVRDVLRVAHADGVLEEEEETVAAQLAGATGISAARLARIKAWVNHELALRAEWQDIIASD